MKTLENKVAIVTGSGRGIGRSIALRLAMDGAKVVVNYVGDSAVAGAVVHEIHSLGGAGQAIRADVAKVAEIRELMSQAISSFGRLDILVSNAGVEHFGTFGEVTEEEFDRTFAVNTRGQFFAMQEASRHMTKGGRLICTSSISASRGFPKHAVYGGSKGANEAFVRNLAVDLGPRGITVNAIAPGPIMTPMYQEFADRYGDPNSKLSVDDQMKHFSPLGRVGQPEDIANVVAFLASEAGGWVNGQVIHVTGGA